MISTQGLVVVLFVASLAIAAHADLTITQQIEKEAVPQEANMTITKKVKEGKMRLDLNPQIDATGLGKTTITVVAVSESLPADSEFVVPDGYRAMQAPAPLSK